MKRNVSKVLSVLLIAALMLSFTAVASAETRMYATNAVNVRSGPGTSYYIIGSLEQNDMVTATGRVYSGWYEIAWGNYGYGYVAGNYLSYSKYEPGYNTGCYTGRRGVSLKVCQDCGDIYYATTALNVRQGPSTKYSIIGSLNRGQQCTAIGKSGNWLKLLTADGSTAYASAKYLKLYARQNGTASTPSTPSYPSGNYGTYYATTGLNVRQGPGTSYRVVYTLDRGESVTYTGQTYGKWISVKTSNGVQGYCSSLYLTQKNSSYNPSGSTGARYYCGRCGKAITYGNLYCSNCGAKIDYSNGGGCYTPSYDVTVGYTYATNYKTPLYASASTSGAEIASLDSGVRVVVSSVTMNGSWAQVYVPYLQSYGYLPVDAIK